LTSSLILAAEIFRSATLTSAPSDSWRGMVLFQSTPLMA
jgi:hypothetical protein